MVLVESGESQSKGIVETKSCKDWSRTNIFHYTQGLVSPNTFAADEEEHDKRLNSWMKVRKASF